MSKPKIYDAYLRIIAEECHEDPIILVRWKNTLKHVCKINKKLNKVCPAVSTAKYVPHGIYMEYPTDIITVREVTNTFVRSVDPGKCWHIPYLLGAS